MAIALAVLKRAKSPRGLHAVVQLTFSGNYAAGGEVVDFPLVVGYTSLQPDAVEIDGKAGYKYEYDKATKKVLVRDHPAFVITGGQGAASALQINPDSNAGVLGKTVATTRTIPGRTLGLIMDELAAAAYPAGVTGDVVLAKVDWIA